MLRKNLMKRLSKSASDLSGCKKKTHSTSPEEEEKDFADDRPESAASCHSVPAFGSEEDGIRTSTRSEKKIKAKKVKHKAAKPTSEVGIRNVGGHIHSVYKGHQGILSLLKERFSRSSSRDGPDSRSSSAGRKHQGAALMPDSEAVLVDGVINSANATPDMLRRGMASEQGDHFSRRQSTPTVHCSTTTGLGNGRAAQNNNHHNAAAAEVIQHHDMPKAEEGAKRDSSAKHNTAVEVQKHKESTPFRQMLGHRQESVSSAAASVHSTDSPPSLPTQQSCDSYSLPEEKIAELRSHPLYHLHVCLRQGRDLPAKDSCGTSDPYVKFYWKGKQVYRSKTIVKDLNPVWDESFILAIDDPFVPLELKVYDYDWALRDDFMGEGSYSLVQLELDKLTEKSVILVESGNTQHLGQIVLGLRLVPKRNTSPDQHEHMGGMVVSNSSGFSVAQHHHQSASAAEGGLFKKKPQQWSAVVNIVLVEGKNLLAMDLEGTSDPYCKVRLGNDRYKSKPIFATLNPRWVEQFDLSLFEDQSQELEITVWDKDQRSKDDFMGRCSIDLAAMEHENTHKLWVDLEEGTGQLFLLVTISGRTHASLDVGDLSQYKEDDDLVCRRRRHYELRNTFKDLNNIGYLQVKIFSAKGLLAADLGGKSDPYVVLELDNTRLQTHTEYKTITPTWNRILNLPVSDIHSVLHVTVYDEDRGHKSEYLGKFAIPLLKIESDRKRWFALRDKKLRFRAKGNNPQILLQMTLEWSNIRAAIRTLNPKEEKYVAATEKFKRQVFLNNVMRIKAIIMDFVNMGKFVESCLEWEHPFRSAVVFVVFLATTYYCQPFWIPIGLLLVFLKNYVVLTHIGSPILHHGTVGGSDDELTGSDFGDDDDLVVDDKEGVGGDKEEKKTLKARLQAIQEVTAMVQNALGYVAHLAEGIKNTFNFSVPFLSWLAIVILMAVTVVLYFINLRFLLMVWGINKFTKKLIRPNYVPNNELLDFLSRVPDDEELRDYREMKLAEDPSSPSKKSASSATAVDKKKKKT